MPLDCGREGTPRHATTRRKPIEDDAPRKGLMRVNASFFFFFVVVVVVVVVFVSVVREKVDAPDFGQRCQFLARASAVAIAVLMPRQTSSTAPMASESTAASCEFAVCLRSSRRRSTYRGRELHGLDEEAGKAGPLWRLVPAASEENVHDEALHDRVVHGRRRRAGRQVVQVRGQESVGDAQEGVRDERHTRRTRRTTTTVTTTATATATTTTTATSGRRRAPT